MRWDVLLLSALLATSSACACAAGKPKARQAGACPGYREVGGWLRVRSPNEVTVIPHILWFGGGPNVVEIAREGKWSTAFEEGGTVRVWELGGGQAALLFFLEVGYYALLSASQPDVKRFEERDAEMGPNRARNAVTQVEWLPKSNEYKGLPDKVRVRHFDLRGKDIDSPQLLDLPHAPGHISNTSRCFYSELVGYQAGVPVLSDEVCGSGLLLLSTPPRPLPDDAPIERIEDGMV